MTTEPKHTPGRPHTPTPWTARSSDNDLDLLFDRDGKHFANLRLVKDDPVEQDAARICECVNACEGIDDPVAALAETRLAFAEAAACHTLTNRLHRALALLGAK